MRHDETLVFVEVRYRARSDFGTGAETVTARKQRRVINTAAHYLQRNPGHADRACRFDVSSISGPHDNPEVEWIVDAFEA